MKQRKAFWLAAGLAAGGTGVAATLWLPDLFPPKVHSWMLGAGAVITGISEGHFKSLISELQGLLRRGSYSAWQLDELHQVIPRRAAMVWRLWTVSLAMKIVVAIAAAALQWDKLGGHWPMVCIVGGYYLLIASIVLAMYAWRSYRQMEDFLSQVARKENETRERNRLLKELKTGPEHNFQEDKILQSYTKPARPI